MHTQPQHAPPASTLAARPQLSAGLSAEEALRASEAPARPEVDAEANIAAKYYLQQIMALDEGAHGSEILA